MERQTINGDYDRFNLIEIIEEPALSAPNFAPLKASGSLHSIEALAPSSSLISASIAVPSGLSALLSMPSKQPTACIESQTCVSSANFSKSNMISRYQGDDLHAKTVVQDAIMKPEHYLFPDNLRQVMMSTLPVVLTEFNYPHRIVKVNKAWETLCGYSESEVLGKTMKFLQGKQTQKTRLTYLNNRIDTELKWILSEGAVEGVNLTNYYRAITVNLTNYKKDGSTFENKVIFLLL